MIVSRDFESKLKPVIFSFSSAVRQLKEFNLADKRLVLDADLPSLGLNLLKHFIRSSRFYVQFL